MNSFDKTYQIEIIPPKEEAGIKAFQEMGLPIQSICPASLTSAEAMKLSDLGAFVCSRNDNMREVVAEINKIKGLKVQTVMVGETPIDVIEVVS